MADKQVPSTLVVMSDISCTVTSLAMQINANYLSYTTSFYCNIEILIYKHQKLAVGAAPFYRVILSKIGRIPK